MKELYETSYKNDKHFSFGKNWSLFLKSLDETKISEAKKSLIDFLGGISKIKDKTFIDVGCGSGLFSLAAYLLDAKNIVSLDVDDYSIECAKYLKDKYCAVNWNIVKCSALDAELLKKFGKFDIVYSWGVLHHTGDMWNAIENVSRLVKPKGLFYLAIYNNNTRFFEGSSNFWLKIKKGYNHSGKFVKKLTYFVYSAYLIAGLVLTGKNPVRYIKSYHTVRGMDFFTDIKDWLGGYPYEFASIKEIVDFLTKKGYVSEKIKSARPIGCNEFLFRKK